MTPSTFCSALVGLLSGGAVGAGGFVSGAKVTFRSPVLGSAVLDACGCSAGVASACAEGEVKVGKGEGNWKK